MARGRLVVDNYVYFVDLASFFGAGVFIKIVVRLSIVDTRIVDVDVDTVFVVDGEEVVP
jgi:hypothetical protein